MKTLTLAVVATIAGAFMASAALTTGEKAPNFTGTDDTGASHQLSDFKGKYVVLEWLNHGCPFVKKHYNSGNMQALQKELTEQGVIWLGIVSSKEGAQGYMTAQKSTKTRADKDKSATAILLDKDGTIGRLYGAVATPEMFVIDPEGILIYQGAIDSISSTRESDIPKATNYVLAAYNAHVNGDPIAKTDTKPYGCSIKY